MQWVVSITPNPLKMMELLRKFDVKTQELLRLIFILAFIHFSQIINAQNSNPINTDTTSEIVGPFSGYLVLTGGGMHAASLKKFVELCGKKNPLIVVITSAGTIEKKGETTYIQIRSMFKDAGTENVKIYFHLDSNESKSDSMYNYLAKADGVWFTGGRQWRLADIYLNKRFINSIQSILNRNGVIGGNSAGASIMGSFLARGDTKSALIMDGDHKTGFGLIGNCAIDQHLLARNRQFDLLEIRKKYPNLLGIGIDERTSIVVHRNKLEVIGESVVAIYDGKYLADDGQSMLYNKENDQKFYFLKAGDTYDLKSRLPHLKTHKN